MSYYTKQNKDVSHTRNWFVLIGFLVLIGLLMYSLVNAMRTIRVSSKSLKEIESEYQQMYVRGQSIENLLQDFDNDFGFEKYVRENFGVVRPNEKIVIIVPDSKTTSEPLNIE